MAYEKEWTMRAANPGATGLCITLHDGAGKMMLRYGQLGDEPATPSLCRAKSFFP